MKEYLKRKKKRLFHLYKAEFNNSNKKVFFIRALYTLIIQKIYLFVLWLVLLDVWFA